MIFKIGEEYWARVLDDGTLADGTQSEALIRFDVMHHGVTMQNAYIAFWYILRGLRFYHRGIFSPRWGDRKLWEQN